MRIVRYTPSRANEDQAPRLGLMLGDDRIGDLRRAFERMLAERGDAAAAEIAALRFPGNLAAHLAGGDVAHQALPETATYLDGDGAGAGGGGHSLIRKLDQCRLLAPVKPWKIIAVGRNYGSHDKEMSKSGAGFPKAVPSAWIKSNSALTGPFDDIQKPAATDALEYETKLTLVISRHCKNVAEADAYDVIAGYMIGVDVTARDVFGAEKLRNVANISVPTWHIRDHGELGCQLESDICEVVECEQLIPRVGTIQQADRLVSAARSRHVIEHREHWR